MSLSAPTRLRSFFSAIATLVLGGLLATGFALPAQADTVDFTVRVASAAGTPLSGMGIAAFAVVDGEADESKPLVNALPVTGQPGVYTLPGLEEVPYTLVMRPSSTATAKAFIQYLGGVSYVDQATTFIPGSDNTSLDVTLAANGVITGTVTGSTKKPVAGVWVTAYRFDGSQWDEYTSVKTSSKGVYSLTDIDPGSYKLEFTDQTAAGHLTRYNGGAATLAAAAPIYVSANKTATSSIALPLGGKITGTSLLYDDWDGYYGSEIRPVAYPVTVAGGVVTLSNPGGRQYGPLSDSRGRWGVGGLSTGKWVVRLVPLYVDVAAKYVNAYGSADDNLQGARVFSVTAGKTISAGTIADLITTINTAKLTVRNANAPSTPVTTATGHLALKYFEEESYTEQTNTSGKMTFGRYEDGSEGMRNGTYVLTVTAPGFEVLTTEWRTDSDTATWLKTVSLTPTSVPLAFATPATLDSAAATVGDSLTVTAATSRTATLAYSWLRDGLPIFGARGSSYTLGGGDLGHHISVRVSASLFGHTTQYSYAHVGGENALVSQGAAAVNMEIPSILAPAVVRPGTKLVGSAGSWNVGGVRPVYSWLRDGEPIAGALGSSYVVTAGDVGSNIHLAVIASKAGRPDSAPSTSGGVLVEPLPAPVAKVAPKLTAKKVGSTTTYTVVPGTWTAGTTFTYQWTVDGVVPEAQASTTKSFPVGTALAGRSIVVKITAKQPGGLSTQRALVAVKGAKLSAPQSAPVVINVIEEIAVTDAAQPVQVGKLLSVAGHTGTWSYPDESTAANFSYQWRKAAPGKAAVAIKGATKAGYTPTIADLKGTLSLAITANSPVYASTTVVVPAGVVIGDLALLHTMQQVTLSNHAFPGSKLTATVGTWPITGVTHSYQWFSNDVAIAKATTATYVPTAAQIGSEIRVRVIASKTGFVSRTLEASVMVSAVTGIDTIEPPQITGGLEGSATLGTPLVVTPGVYDVPVTRTYLWERGTAEGWAPVAGIPVGPRYTPVVGDFQSEASGHIRVTETVAAGAYSNTSTAQVEIFEGSNVLVTAPKVTASKTAWSVTDGTWRAPGTTVSWQWSVDGQPVDTLPARTLAISGKTGKTVVATATVTAPGYGEVVRELVVQKGAKPISPTDVISGTPKVAAELTAPHPYFEYPDWADGARTVGFQWLLNGAVIKGATAQTYTARVADLGKKISVRLTIRDAYRADGVYTTPAVVVTAATITGSAALVAPGGVLAGSSVSAALTGYPSSVAHAYQWQSAPAGSTAFVAIAGATKAGYIPKLTEVGRELRVRIITTRAGFTTKTTYSDAATIVSPTVLAPVTAPAISGSATVGSTLTVSPGSWNVAATTFGYQWYRNGVAIPGATATTFVPLSDSHNDELWVVVTAKSVGYATATWQSNVVTPGLGAAPIALAGKGPKITGTAKTCTTLTASSGTWNLDGLTFSYAWAVDGDVVTGRTLDLGQGLVGQTVTVTVTATRAGYLVGTATSAATTAITSGNCG